MREDHGREEPPAASWASGAPGLAPLLWGGLLCWTGILAKSPGRAQVKRVGGKLRPVSCSTLFAPSVLLEPESETVRAGSLEGNFRPRLNSFQLEVRGRDFVLGSQLEAESEGSAPSSGTRDWSVRLGAQGPGMGSLL